MDKHYTANVVSMSDVTLIRFPLAFFHKVLEANPRLYLAILKHAELERGSLLQKISAKA
jgi:CRP-like cAMP-binding protein